MKKIIDGYSYRTKNGIKSVEGLGGDFAYLRCRRIKPAKLDEIDHEQVWTALQLTHMPTLMAFDNSKPLAIADHEDDRLIYIPHFRARDTRSLTKAVAAKPACIVYTWQPALIKMRLRNARNVEIQPIPETLARRFGIRL